MDSSSRPLHLVIGASRGSASHIVASALAPHLSDQLQQEVILNIIPGNDGLAAARYVSEAKSDGHTVLVSTFGMHVMSPGAPAPREWDINAHLRPVCLLASCPLLLAVHPSVEAHNLEALSRLVTSGPRTLTYASSAIGGAPHLAAELYLDMIQGEMNHAVYQETQELFSDLVSGRIALSFNNIMTLGQLVASGKARGIAVTSAKRAASAPNIPTLAESGLPGYELTNWLGILGPSRLDDTTVSHLNQSIRNALDSEILKQEVNQLGIELHGSSAEELALRIGRDRARWKSIADKIRLRKATA